MTFSEDDNVIDALSTDRANQSLDVGILPRRPRCGHDFLDTHIVDPALEPITIDLVSIANHVLGCGVQGKGLDDLKSSPLGIGMLGDVEVDDSPAVMRENNQNKQNPECCCGNHIGDQLTALHSGA